MDLARYIEHTLLGADVTPERIERHCSEAVEHGVLAVCVAPLYVSLADRCLRGSRVRLVTVVAFPFGAAVSSVKAEEARRAAEQGAREVDMVMAIGLALDGQWGAVEADIETVRKAAPEAALKVIIETGYFDGEGIVRAADAAVSAGADFVKTCTGYGPRGATMSDVELLFERVRGRAEIKASGGIRSADAARRFIEAGAARIGTSRGVDMLRSR